MEWGKEGMARRNKTRGKLQGCLPTVSNTVVLWFFIPRMSSFQVCQSENRWQRTGRHICLFVCLFMVVLAYKALGFIVAFSKQKWVLFFPPFFLPSLYLPCPLFHSHASERQESGILSHVGPNLQCLFVCK